MTSRNAGLALGVIPASLTEEQKNESEKGSANR